MAETDRRVRRFFRWIGFDSWARVEFDFANYSRLRNSGLSAKETHAELDRLWEETHPNG